jgi:hypothetical protein
MNMVNNSTCSDLPWNFFGGRGQQIQLKTEGRENGDMGAVAPRSRVPLNLQMNETHILIWLLQMYMPRNWEFSSALSKLQNFGGCLTPPLGMPLSTCLTFTLTST